MATSVTVSWINIFIARLQPVWGYIIARHYRGYTFWRPVDAHNAFY